jgi:hypothetical protein
MRDFLNIGKGFSSLNVKPKRIEQRLENDSKEKIFVLKWTASALAAGITQLSNSNSLTIANNDAFEVVRISAYGLRRSSALAIQQAASINLQLSSALKFTDSLITSAIGAQWTSNLGALATPVYLNLTPDAPQAFAPFKFLGGADLVVNLTAFSFGTTVLNDVVEAQIHFEFE